MKNEQKSQDLRKEVLDSFKSVPVSGALWSTGDCIEKIAILSDKVQKKSKQDPNYNPLKDISRAVNDIVGDIAQASRPDVMICVDHEGTQVDSSMLKVKLHSGEHVGPISVHFWGYLNEDWLRCPTDKPVDKLAGQICEEIILKLMSPETQKRYVDYHKIPQNQRPLVEPF